MKKIKTNHIIIIIAALKNKYYKRLTEKYAAKKLSIPEFDSYQQTNNL